MSDLFNKPDNDQLQARGITIQQAVSQIETLGKGFPYAHLLRPCTVADGITVFDKADLKRLGGIFSQSALSGRVMKFVPASGAASRMFQLLLSVNDQSDLTPNLEELEEAEQRDMARFFSNIKKFAFYDDLNSVITKAGLDISASISKGQHGEVLQYLLTDKGLNYGNLPKGLIKFHNYKDHCRTAFEEHLTEAAAYAQDKNGLARVHFTVSTEHREIVEEHLEEVGRRYEKAGTKYEISLSEQKPSTDTLAVDLENLPFRDQTGNLLFRPGGHGALLENLGELGGDIIFIKNIDNIAPDRLKGDTVAYKKALGGLLMELQNQIFRYLRELSKKQITEQLLEEIFEFVRRKFSVVPPDQFRKGSRKEKAGFLFDKLNRPLRVCGMVPSTGAPGGGPFWVGQDTKTASPQIVESSQVNLQSEDQRAIWESSTHFNPVDIVCGVRDFLGNPFDLKRFSDPIACTISVKSMDGRPLKALELPGLWNGAMSNWNTVFVEVPLSTFNPVKTVFDLLEKPHQAG